MTRTLTQPIKPSLGLKAQAQAPEHEAIDIPSRPLAKGPRVMAIRLSQNPQHPFINLFESRTDAQALAKHLGAPWCPVAYACGYVLTDGWNFHDAKGPLPTFCPVPPDALPSIQDLVRDLSTRQISGRELARQVIERLRDIPALSELRPPLLEAACTCAIMRMCYPPPTGDKGDWLTMPAWALKLPRRRLRITAQQASEQQA